MDQIYPDNGLVFMLTSIVQNGLVWHLFTNDVEPTLDDDLTTYIEAAWSGYAPKTVLAADFTFEQLQAHVGQVSADVLEWINGSGLPQTVCGFFITDITNTFLVGVARFDDAPRTYQPADPIQIFPGIANFSGLAS